MSRLRWLVGLLGVVVLATICLNMIAEQRTAALAADVPADLLKRIETLEARVAMLEGQLARVPRVIPLRTVQSRDEPKYWSKREFNGAPVYIVPLGGAEAKK
jgi:hypothetical protein